MFSSCTPWMLAPARFAVPMQAMFSFAFADVEARASSWLQTPPETAAAVDSLRKSRRFRLRWS